MIGMGFVGRLLRSPAGESAPRSDPGTNAMELNLESDSPFSACLAPAGNVLQSGFQQEASQGVVPSASAGAIPVDG